MKRLASPPEPRTGARPGQRESASELGDWVGMIDKAGSGYLAGRDQRRWCHSARSDWWNALARASGRFAIAPSGSRVPRSAGRVRGAADRTPTEARPVVCRCFPVDRFVPRGSWRVYPILPEWLESVGGARMRLRVAAGAAMFVLSLAMLGLGVSTAIASSGPWGSATELLPPGGGSDTTGLDAVACVGSGECVAVGYLYQGGALAGSNLVFSESGGAWGAPVEISAPGSPGTSEPYLQAIACPAAGSCAVAGTYDDSSGDMTVMVDDEANGTWQPSVPIALPGNVGDRR